MEQVVRQRVQLGAKEIVSTLRKISERSGPVEERVKEARETPHTYRLSVLCFDPDLNVLNAVAKNHRTSAKALNTVAFALVYDKKMKDNMQLAVDTAYTIMEHPHTDQKTFNTLSNFKHRGIGRALLRRIYDVEAREKLIRELDLHESFHIRTDSSEVMASA